MSIVCIYVHSQQQEEKPVYLYTMASDGQTKESKALGLGLGRFAPASQHGGPGVPGWGQQRAALAFRSLLRARAARTALCHLWLVSCLGFVVSVTVQVSQQGVAIGQSIRGQQLPDLLHRLLISHFLLLQGPD